MSDNLVVISKLKKLVKDLSGMNTSANAIDPLNKVLKAEIVKAIANAKKNGRKTVMDRDFQFDESLWS